MSATRFVREMLAYAEAEAAPLGIAVVLAREGRHAKLVFRGRGTRRVKPLSRAPVSPDHQAKIVRQDIRRLLRDMTGRDLPSDARRPEARP